METKFDPDNERIKRAYLIRMAESQKKSQPTVDNIRKAICKFEEFTGSMSFKKFDKDQAIEFKAHLASALNNRTGKPLSKSTVLSITRNLMDFFKWLREKNGYKKLSADDIEYFNLTEKERREASIRRRKRAPTLEQVKLVISLMPHETEVQKRNQAMIAFEISTGIRDGALISLKLKHINIQEGLVEQLPDEVRTKNSKTIYTYFFPVGQEILEIFLDWIRYLRTVKLYGDDDPVFPRTKMALDKNNSFVPDGIEPECWQTAESVRQIFREAFKNAGLEYFNPHSFRMTLVRLGEKLCGPPEEFKAWSQNLGHEDVLTTFTSYGDIDEYTQGEVMKGFSKSGASTTKASLEDIKSDVRMLLKKLEDKEKGT
jgi:integrase/recombinase XerD